MPNDCKLVFEGGCIMVGLVGIASMAMPLAADVQGAETVDTETPDNVEVGDSDHYVVAPWSG